MNKTLKIVLLLVILAVASLAIVIALKPEIFFGKKLYVLHAGSLTVPFEKIAEEFEARHPGVDVVLLAAGSRELAMKIRDLGTRADVYASADYKVIEDVLMPSHASWYAIFVSNEIVIAYTDKSKYADEINSTNWYEILVRNDVKWGHSDPNLDPCGYRALIVIKLAEIYYGVEGLYEKLANASNVLVRPKSVDLIALLESGELDYAFEYKSVAVQHGLKYVELPDEINLSNPKYNDFYAKANVTLSDGTVVVGEAIMYAVTIPSTAVERELAIEFIRFLLTDGMKIIEECGMVPITPAIGSGDVPQELADLVVQERSTFHYSFFF